MKWRKKKNLAAAATDPVERDLIFPVGAPLIAGGDNVYAVYSALSLALFTLHNFEKAMPKKAKQLSPVSEVWRTLYQRLQPYAYTVEHLNASDDDI